MSAAAPAIPASSADAHALLSQYHPPELSLTLLHDKIHNKPLPLHTSTDARTQRRLLRASKSRRPARKPAPLTAREKRSLNVHNPPKNKRLEYATFAPLRELWLEYARALVAMGGGAPAVAQRLAAGDLHGAVVMVVRSRCVDRVGIRGVVVKDTRGALLIVPEEGGGGKSKYPPFPRTGSLWGAGANGLYSNSKGVHGF
jgi:ribonuclease P protein subunit POP4